MILLTTPFSYTPGHAIPEKICTHVKITNFYLDSDAKYMVIRCAYGSIQNNQFVQMIDVPSGEHVIRDEPPLNKFSQLVDSVYATTTTERSLYDEVGLSIYVWLLNEEKYIGEIIET